MTQRIDREGFSAPVFEEDEFTLPLFDAPPQERLSSLAEDALELGRVVYGRVKEAQAAIDLEGNIGALGPGDSLKLRASAQGRIGVGGALGEALEVKRGSDGRYTVSGSAELGAALSQRVEVGTKALQAVGLEQTGGARVELSCESPAEAAQAARALRNLQLRQLNVPVGDAAEDLRVLAKTASAVEVGARVGGSAEGGFSLLGSNFELRGSARAETTVRYELQKNELVLKHALGAEGGAPLKLAGLVPGASASALGLGPGLKSGVKVEAETRVKLGTDATAAPASAKWKLTFSSESREAAVTMAAGREAKVSLEVDAQQAKAALEALATQNPSKLAPLLDARVSVEARSFDELGGELSLGVSVGAVGGSVALEAKLRDVDDAGTRKATATLGDALRWITSS